MPSREKLIAYVAPMAFFVGLLGLNGLLKTIGGPFWLRASEYWIYPLQTVVCGALICWFWRAYSLQKPRKLGLGIGIGVLVFVIWIAPQAFLGSVARRIGFNPELFGAQPTIEHLTVLFRFLRLVLVVPLIEEIFWRGFLLRYLIDEEFDRVPFGAFSWLSFTVVTGAFALSHSPSDWPAAVITGGLYNAVAYRTKSLSTCVMTHAVTNLLLGLWIMQTKQWGFW
jgi:CAAX protease family protein